MPRLFIALRPPRIVREALLATMSGVPGARWQSDDQLHLTLAFLGEVEPRMGDALVDVLGEVRARPFSLQISGVGHFERKGAVSALWAALAPSEPLMGLQRRVASACRRAGCAPDRKSFTPHITLARMNRASATPGGWLAAHGTLHSAPWTVKRFIIYQSHLRTEGSLYEPLLDFPLIA